jgi:hypothetical protein
MSRTGVLGRIGMLAGIAALLATAGCRAAGSTTAAPVPVASAATVLNPVPERTTTSAKAAATRPRHASPAPRTAAPTGDAGSGDAGLDRFVAAVQRDLPGVALDRRDEEVEALGEQACAGLEAGKTDTAVAGEIGAEEVTAADARKLVTLARSTACPGRPKVGEPAQ